MKEFCNKLQHVIIVIIVVTWLWIALVACNQEPFLSSEVESTEELGEHPIDY